jgi:pimeloyl-ACP methyl ester carboxylesterase
VLENGLRLADFAYAPSPQGGVPLYALVAVQAGDTYWHARADGDDAMAMLLDEFIPFIEDRLNGGRPAPMAVMGWSMGGYGALRAGEVRPGRFRAVCAVSPALWESFEEGVGDAFDDAADYDEHDVYAGAGVYDGAGVHPLLRVDCGRQDPFADAVRAFRAAVPAPPEGGFSPGGHDDGYWRRVAPAETAFVAAALAG